MFNYKPYLWIFNDSVKSQVDTVFFVGAISERDILYKYILNVKNQADTVSFVGGNRGTDILDKYMQRKRYTVSIWEFKDLSKIKLDEVSINSNRDLGEVSIMPYELIGKNEIPEITVELGFSFNHSVSLNIDKHSEIIKTIETPAYKGFYGLVNKLSLSNEKGKHLIVFDYPGGNEPTLFLLYKTSAGFYVVFINSRNVPFDESILKLLNLS